MLSQKAVQALRINQFRMLEKECTVRCLSCQIQGAGATHMGGPLLCCAQSPPPPEDQRQQGEERQQDDVLCGAAEARLRAAPASCGCVHSLLQPPQPQSHPILLVYKPRRETLRKQPVVRIHIDLCRLYPQAFHAYQPVRAGSAITQTLPNVGRLGQTAKELCEGSCERTAG